MALCIVALAVLSASAQETDIELRRISERVVYAFDGAVGGNAIIGIATSKGLVFVDSTSSPAIAAQMRAMIEEALGRADAACLINTHDHDDHTGGNQAFAGCTIIAHDLCRSQMQSYADSVDEMVPRWRQWIAGMQSQLEELDPDSEQARMNRIGIAALTRRLQRSEDGFVPTLPTITFSDRMTLDMGDLTLRLYYTGRETHTSSHIVIHVPEEGLLCAGDMFAPTWMQFIERPQMDVERWIDVLSTVLADPQELRVAVTAHFGEMNRRQLEIRREYMSDLHRLLSAAKGEGKKLQDVQEAFRSLENFPYLSELDTITEDALQTHHENNIRLLWWHLHEAQSAAAYIETLVRRQGAQTAISEFEDIKGDHDRFIFDEQEFNALGYRLLREGHIEASVALFTMNTELFPDSWNAHDSLAESFVNARLIEQALASYRRSLELNPQNSNAERWIEELERNGQNYLNETPDRSTFTPSENTGLQGPYLGQEPPGLEPKIFAPGIVSTSGVMEFFVTLTPDGRELYFNSGERIRFCRWTDEGWTAPVTTDLPGFTQYIAPFDGNKIYITRFAPAGEPNAEPVVGVWTAERSDEGWGRPRFLIPGMHATVTADGTIFTTEVTQSGGYVAVSRLVDGSYSEPEKLEGGFVAPGRNGHACAAPDGSFVVFDSDRASGMGGETGSLDLLVCFRNDDGSWSDAFNLGPSINTAGDELCPSLSPDGRYLFYNADSDIYWVSTEVIERLRP